MGMVPSDCSVMLLQGAIALERREDLVWVHLIESVPFKRKEFDLIGEHLIAFVCKRSMELGFEGAVAFHKLVSNAIAKLKQARPAKARQ